MEFIPHSPKNDSRAKTTKHVSFHESVFPMIENDICGKFDDIFVNDDDEPNNNNSYYE